MDEHQQTRHLQIDENKIPEIIRLVRKRYDGWDGFSHPAFQKDEVSYKRNASQKAQTLLDEAVLSELMDAKDFSEIILRVREVARASNLMYLSHPRSGDLKLLNLPDLDESLFCSEFFALLYDSEPVPARLDRFFDYVKRLGSTVKWTFPTYYLFLCFPESEIYIKPMMMRWFVELMNGPQTYPWTPSRQAYEAIQSMFHQLKSATHKYGPQDMIDIHSLIWPAYREAEKETNRTLAEPFNSMFADIAEAEWAFDLLADIVERVSNRGIDDPRFALTLAEGYIRLNFGNWVIIDFPPNSVTLALLADSLDNETYKRADGFFAKTRVSFFYFSRQDLRPFPPEVQRCAKRNASAGGVGGNDWDGGNGRKDPTRQSTPRILPPGHAGHGRNPLCTATGMRTITIRGRTNDTE